MEPTDYCWCDYQNGFFIISPIAHQFIMFEKFSIYTHVWLWCPHQNWEARVRAGNNVSSDEEMISLEIHVFTFQLLPEGSSMHIKKQAPQRWTSWGSFGGEDRKAQTVATENKKRGMTLPKSANDLNQSPGAVRPHNGHSVFPLSNIRPLESSSLYVCVIGVNCMIQTLFLFWSEHEVRFIY